MTGLVTALGSGAMTNSIDDITRQAKSIFIIGSNTTEQHPVIGIKIRRAVREGVKLVIADPRTIDIASYATMHLRHRPGTDIALLNGLMHVIIAEDLWDKEFVARRTEGFEEVKAVVEKYDPEWAAEITGLSADEIREAARILGTNKPGALLYAMGITQHTMGHQNVLACANLQMLLGNLGIPGGGVNPLRGQNNVQGACDMGALPNVFPGYQSVADDSIRAKFEKGWGVTLSGQPGLTVTEIINGAETGRIKGMYIVGENPMMSDPDINHVEKCLKSLEFLVVQDIFLNETAQLADVVLPGVSYAEKEGTFTNTERRVQLIRQAIEPLGHSRADWEIVCQLARRMTGGKPSDPSARYGGWDYTDPSAVMEELAALTPIYGGIAHLRLERKGLQWPCPDKDHPGTPILHVGKFSRGLGRFNAVEHLPPDELPDEDYPLVLTTGRVIYHWHGGTLTRRSQGLDAICPEALVEISPEDAAALGVADGELVRVTSRRGELVAKAEVVDRPRSGVVFMTFHFAEAAANLLTNPALDPMAKIPEYKVCAVRVESLSS